MKWLFLLLALLIPGLANAQSYNALSYTAGSFNKAGCSGGGGVCDADLASLPTTLNGTITYCKDCQRTNPCSSGGTGALAAMVAGVWSCNAAGQPPTTPTAVFPAGPVSITGNSGNGTDQISNVSLNGLVNVKTYGAVGDGVHDDTANIQAAINATMTKSCLFFPTGTYLVTNDINATSPDSVSGQICIRGTDPVNTIIKCVGGSINACFDLSGEDAFSIRDIQFSGGTLSNGSDAPRTLLLLARTGNQGYGHDMSNVWTATNGAQVGKFTIYDYGAEMAQWRNVRSNTAMVVISSCNHANMISKFQTLIAPQTSMSVVNIAGGNFDGGGQCAIELDNNCGYPTAGKPVGVIHNIAIWGTFFGEYQGGGSAICDNLVYGNQVVDLSIIGTRMEASDVATNYRYIDLHSYVFNLKMINDEEGGGAPNGWTVPSVDLHGGYIDQSDIELYSFAAFCNFTGQITGTALGVSAITSGVNPAIGQYVYGAGVAPGTQITGNNGTNWIVNNSQTVAAESMQSVTPTVDAGGGRANLFAMPPINVTPSGSSGNPPGLAPGTQAETFGNSFKYMSQSNTGHFNAGGNDVNFEAKSLNGNVGYVQWTMPQQGGGGKTVIMAFQGYQNTTATVAHIIYPTTFNANPSFFGCPTGFFTDGAQAYIPASMAAAFTGQCVVQGF